MVEKQKDEVVRISPIGGCGEFGKNLTLYMYKGAVYAVDCGIKFAEVWQPGITGSIADYVEVFSKYGKPTAYIITHGHEDHIGATPLFYEEFPAPIYTTAWTHELLKIKFEKYGVELKDDVVRVMKPYETSEFADGFCVDWLPMNHSIPMTCSLLIRTPSFKIYHSGDFKFDPDPPYEPRTDVEKLKSLQPVDLLLVDSTNAKIAGNSPSEREVREPLQRHMKKDYDRIYVATFASNLWRIKQVVEIAQALGKKVYACSRAIETSIDIGIKLGLFDTSKYKVDYITRTTTKLPHNVVVLVSGCQGERFSTLAKLAQDRVRACRLGKKDLIIFSSRPIPGNELPIIKICERIKEKGTEIISVREDRGVHVSGHAHGGDIQDLVSYLAPKTIMPVHGNYSHLGGVQSLQPDAHVVIPSNGELFELSENGVRKIAEERFGELFVDAESLTPLSFATMKDRVRLGEFGLCEVVGVVDKTTHAWLYPPRINRMVGIVEQGEVEHLCERVGSVVAPQLSSKNWADMSLDDINDKVRVLFKRHVNLCVGKKTFVTSNIVEL